MTWMQGRSTLAGSLVALLLLLPSATSASSGFSRSELRRLRAGRLVTRPLSDSPRYVGGNAWIVVNAPERDIWETLTNPRHYARMWRQVRRMRVLASRGNRQAMYVRLRAPIQDLDYVVSVVFHPARREIDFRLARAGGQVHDAWGFFRLEPRGPSKTLVAYGAAVNPGPVIRALFENRLRRHLLGLPKGVKRYVERRRRAARGSSGRGS